MLDETGAQAPPATTPFGRQFQRGRVPWVSWGIIGLSAAMFFIFDRMLAEAGASACTSLGLRQCKPWILYGPLVQQGQTWRALGYVFEHGDILHIALNMSVVWTLGMGLERSIASWRFLIISVVTALGGAVFALLFGFNQPMVGASGRNLGWAGATLPISTRQGQKTLATWLIPVAVISLLPMVSWQGHLGGFLFGLPCGLALRNGRRTFALLAPLLLLAAVGAVLWASRSGQAVRFTF
jgi:membrane associated rhomboid family serine protease